jgi:hypothetical protein
VPPGTRTPNPRIDSSDEWQCHRVSRSAGYFRGHRAPIEHRDWQSVLNRRTRRGSGEGVEAADFDPLAADDASAKDAIVRVC